jgi:hypothetical protein
MIMYLPCVWYKLSVNPHKKKGLKRAGDKKETKRLQVICDLVYSQRLNYCHQLGDPRLSLVITQFRGALKAGLAARSTQDALKCSGTVRKTGVRRGAYSVSEKEQLQLLLNAGSLDNYAGRASAAATLSNKSGVDMTETQVKIWAQNNRARVKRD